jgi:hypothetical protein
MSGEATPTSERRRIPERSVSDVATVRSFAPGRGQPDLRRRPRRDRGVPHPSRHGPDTSRVLATVLFTDIVGSTERATQLGDLAWWDLLYAHDGSSAVSSIGSRGGRSTPGDGFVATIDGPGRAVECARDPIRRPGARDLGQGGTAHGARSSCEGRHRRDRRARRSPTREPCEASGGADLGRGPVARRRVRHPVRGPRRIRPQGRPRPMATLRTGYVTDPSGKCL